MTGQKTPSKKADVDSFLKQINFDQRVENDSWTTKELREIVRNVIGDYFNGKVDEDFVVDVGSAIHYGIFHDDEALMSATCTLSDMDYEKYRKQYPSIDQAFREALGYLSS
jgi:hypothetical protein